MNKSMTIIITMAGAGSRFREAGFNVPKYMIEAKGKTLFDWSMDTLIDYNEHVQKYVFVVRKEDNATDFISQHCKGRGIRDFDIVELNHLTDGQATTAMMALPYCNSDSSIMVYNIDTYVEPGELRFKDISGDGYIPCFHAGGTHWSFVKLNGDGHAVEVREKERISNNCTLGAYYFSSAQLYKEVYEDYYKDDRHMEKNEKYIAPLYNFMIQRGFDVNISIIDFDKVHVLGTPKELNIFLYSN